MQAIQRRHPEAAISWVVGRIEYQLVHDLPGIDVVSYDKRSGLKGLLALRARLSERFDVLVQMQLSLRANLVSRFIRARRRVGFAAHLSKEFHGLFVNERVTMPARPHVADGFYCFAKALGAPDAALRWEIPLPAAAHAWVDERVAASARLLVIAPTASSPERSWHAAGYAEVADYAIKNGFVVALTGGPGEADRALAAAVANACAGPVLNLAGESTLKQLLALLARADIVIAPDSGPAHMAVTQGTPVIGLYAHSNPDRTGPHGNRDRVVSVYAKAIEEQRGATAEAVPWGTRARGDHLMAEIDVESVCAMFDRVCDETGLR